MADEKIIFSMVGVSKTFTNQKKVLNNIYLSFFYGAKIGIIGLNGSGKSTLMKIIAGLDKNFQGEVVFSPGYTVGYLEQEPRLDDSKTVREVVEEGCAATVALLKEYEEINMKLCEPMDDEQMARLIERQGELYEQIDQVNGWELDSVLERAMDALRCPDESYVAEVTFSIDGQPVERVKLPALYRTRRHELFWRYRLPSGPHRITAEWHNPRKDASLQIRDLLVYGSTPQAAGN